MRLRQVSLAVLTTLAARATAPSAASAQRPATGIDSVRAAGYFAEAAMLCEREGGRRWGVSLCGPIVIADPVTKSIITNVPAPSAPRPAMLGYANSAVQWGDTRWMAVVWQHLVGADEAGRRILLIHELFHRVQPQLGFMLPEPKNDHLDSYDGRYWLQLEWRALAAAVGASGRERTAALRDALAFRSARQRAVPGAAENERILEINEGLAQYTGTVAAFPEAGAAAASVVRQLGESATRDSYVRTFAYASGAAYGVLLDAWSPGWTRRARPTDDLAVMVARAAGVQPAGDAAAAAKRYGGDELAIAEKRRAAAHAALVGEYRRRFVDGPVLTVPKGNSASFITNGMTPIDSAGTIYPSYRTTTAWGSLEAAHALVAADGRSLVLSAPTTTEGRTLRGEGWTIELADGWEVRPGSRPGDFVLVRAGAPAAGAPAAGPGAAQMPAADPADVSTIEAIVRVSYEVISGPAGTPRQWRRDSTLYAPGATFVATGERNGKPVARSMTAEEYRKRVDAGFVAEGFIEREIGSRIERFGNVAQVRSVYEARRSAGGPVIARGTNYYMLYWDGARWWITGMVWDDERPSNPVPRRWIGVHEKVP